jgi:uncharacterized radical SAM protein YgiQ
MIDPKSRIISSLSFIPVSKSEMHALGWDQPDIILISGDAYVDHPAFGTAIIARVLQAHGFRIGIIDMPDWRDPGSIARLGKPRLFFAISSGNVDSMIARYTAFKRFRSDDPYVPGGKAGKKPDRAVLVYCNLVKQMYNDVPLVLGGIEASMRRMPHYDFWDDRVRRSILLDARADSLVYGMGEKAIVELAHRFNHNQSIGDIPGTVCIHNLQPDEGIELPPEEDILKERDSFLGLYRLFYKNQDKTLCMSLNSRWWVQNPPVFVSEKELDEIYELPFRREPHPSYKEPIPAFEMIKHSITAHRGCMSGCSFCSLSLHQGKRITSRSKASVLREVAQITNLKEFKGHISDIGGPSANMYGAKCLNPDVCHRISCIYPSRCRHLETNSTSWLDLLDLAQNVPGVKRVTVGSGLRYDLLMEEPDSRNLLKRLLTRHISGQLKIAPEHTSKRVLTAMRKKPLVPLQAFVKMFRELTKDLGKEQYPLPYLMSCHPGSDDRDMHEMKKEILKGFGFVPHQVQAFIPLPMTLSSVIYFTGKDPITQKEYIVKRDAKARRRQHQIFFNRGKRKRKK